MQKINPVNINIAFLISDFLWYQFGKQHGHLKIQDILYERNNPWKNVQWEVQEEIKFNLND